MNILQAFGLLLLGAGLGALLIWLQQTGARKQFRQELQIQIGQAFLGELRRHRLLNVRQEKRDPGRDPCSESNPKRSPTSSFTRLS